MSQIYRCLIALIFVGAAGSLSSAQQNLSIRGIVEDQSGAVVSSAKVILLSRNGGKSEQVYSDEEGYFSFKNVASGKYLLKVESEGFQDSETTIAVGTTTVNLKIRMTIVAGEQVMVTSSVVDRVSPESNSDAVKINDNLLRTLPTESQNLLPLISRFVTPAAAGSAGISIVVDGIESDQLDDLPGSAIKRIAIDRNPYSVEFRRPGKARVEVTTKTGSQKVFHGGVALFARNSIFDARGAFPRTKPYLDRQLWDAAFSGPLWWKRSSFFLSGQLLTSNETAVVNASTLNGPLVRNVPAPKNRTDLLGRIDFRTPTHTVSFVAALDRRRQKNHSVGGLFLGETGDRRDDRANRVQVSDQALLSSRTLINTRVLARNLVTDIGTLPTAPAIVVNGAFVGGMPQSSRLEHQNFIEIDNVTLHNQGNHVFRLGGTDRIRLVHGFDQSNFAGTYEFAGLDQFALGLPHVFRINQGKPDISLRMHEVSGFAQDDIRWKPNLNVSLGLRYDWQSAIDQRSGFAPRIALAYAPGGQTTVLRAGAGIFYDTLPEAALWRASLLNGINQTEWVIQNPAFPTPNPPGIGNVPPSIFRLTPNLKAPYLIHATGSVEHQLWNGAQLTLEGYTMHAAHLFRTRNINAPLPQTGLRPLDAFFNLNQLESTATMDSSGFTANFRGRVGKRAYLMAQYTFSRTMNDTGGIFNLPANNYDLRQERGRADFDRRHRFALNGMLELPAAMRIGTALAISSGAPFDITTGFDNNHDSVGNDRPPGVTRNTGQGSGLVELDFRVSKLFRLPRPFNRESAANNVDVNFDIFNALNHVNPSSFIGVTSSPFFGRPTTTLLARTLQLSIRYRF